LHRFILPFSRFQPEKKAHLTAPPLFYRESKTRDNSGDKSAGFVPGVSTAFRANAEQSLFGELSAAAAFCLHMLRARQGWRTRGGIALESVPPPRSALLPILR
jgi:hypothetical protein